MAEADCYRKMAELFDDVQMLINVIALLPYGVKVHGQPPPRRLLDRVAPYPRIPLQRRPVDLWPVPRPTPPGVPPVQRIQLPRRRR